MYHLRTTTKDRLDMHFRYNCNHKLHTLDIAMLKRTEFHSGVQKPSTKHHIYHPSSTGWTTRRSWSWWTHAGTTRVLTSTSQIIMIAITHPQKGLMDMMMMYIIVQTYQTWTTRRFFFVLLLLLWKNILFVYGVEYMIIACPNWECVWVRFFIKTQSQTKSLNEWFMTMCIIHTLMRKTKQKQSIILLSAVHQRLRRLSMHFIIIILLFFFRCHFFLNSRHISLYNWFF